MYDSLGKMYLLLVKLFFSKLTWDAYGYFKWFARSREFIQETIILVAFGVAGSE